MGTPFLTFLVLIFCKHHIESCRYSEVAADEQVAILNKKFLDLLNEKGDNYVYSPASIVFALALLEAGAAGKTRSEIQTQLGFSLIEGSEQLFGPRIHSLHQILLESPNSNVTLNIANGFFHKDNAEIKEDYKNEITCFDAEIDNLPYNDDEALGKVNQWVSDKTKHKIPHLFERDQINEDTKSVLVNAIYMNAKWEYNFYVNNDDFHSCRAHLQNVLFLIKQSQFETWKVAGETAVGIDYSGSEHQMVLVTLPTLPNNVDCTEAKETLNPFARLFFDATTQREPEKLKLILKFPKFSFRTKLDLKPMLESIGLGSLFSKEADFSRMSDIGLTVDTAVHEAFIKVTENGTEAAAATGIVAGVPISRGFQGIPIVIKFDRPFLFYIKHKKTKAILFAGRINYIENSD